MCCRTVWFNCYMLYILICKNCFILLETQAGTLSVLIYTGIPIMAMTSNKCVITESVFSELKAIICWNPEYEPIVWCPYFNFPNSAKWNTFICQILFLWIPFRLLPAGNGVWLHKKQVGDFLIISLACCQVMKENLSSNLWY